MSTKFVWIFVVEMSTNNIMTLDSNIKNRQQIVPNTLLCCVVIIQSSHYESNRIASHFKSYQIVKGRKLMIENFYFPQNFEMFLRISSSRWLAKPIIPKRSVWYDKKLDLTDDRTQGEWKIVFTEGDFLVNEKCSRRCRKKASSFRLHLWQRQKSPEIP